ncbi:UDP-N-acetylglucosamine 2-epimerase [Micromonospora pisi]|uniref:UDP-N-acetylglucosamine 2-epimerase (non-hydrolyzing) n=1 Tax=Micromonospora pisi TaxID=589240 RepID=A0A495JQN0_9ACTN|nr:UDP-N-acetylglucosamine 2-epimerase (non-hydrolyzing) [Micromonospora pisi]RKR91141.1 UDP-N-acetylglucosamine 2-epimerase [Micromonospora pisi]
MRGSGSTSAEVMVLIGTRPEGVKTAPLVRQLRLDTRFTATVVDTGQHPGRVGEALAPFGLTAGVTLEPVRHTGSLAELAAALITATDAVLAEHRPAAVVVQGGTLTALVGGVVAFWHHLPVVHLEAGLRTHDLDRPFPEEANRAMLARFAALHLAPTPTAHRHLLDEGVPEERIVVTGNTVVDALHHLIDHGLAQPPRWIDPTRRLIVATLHRRENWGGGVFGVCAGLRHLARRHPDVQIVMVTHPNPTLGAEVTAQLGRTPGIRLTPPLPYPEMVGLLSVADLVITDSGGLQEEAGTLGVPVLVTRETTERPEIVSSGYGTLVGTDPERIIAAAAAELAVRSLAERTSAFGDGQASVRAVAAIADLLALPTKPVEPTRLPVPVASVASNVPVRAA